MLSDRNLKGNDKMIPLIEGIGKDADGSRYEILPIRTAIASGLFPKETDRLTNAISRLRTRTESDFDSGK